MTTTRGWQPIPMPLTPELLAWAGEDGPEQAIGRAAAACLKEWLAVHDTPHAWTPAEHFDLCESKRREAIRFGAVPTTARADALRRGDAPTTQTKGTPSDAGAIHG